MIKSESIMNLAEALAKAQATIGHAHKDNKNPFFNSTYADLASVWDACRKPLTDNKLSVTQLLENDGDKSIKCITILMHGSGEYIGSEFSMLPKDPSPQAGGSCATYLRRYALQSIVGIAPSDDDGNEASPPPNQRGNNYAAPKNTSSYSAPQQKDPDQPSTSKFDPTNPAHQMAAKAFLEKKKKPQMLAEFMTLMTGQTTTSLSLEATWQRMQNARE